MLSYSYVPKFPFLDEMKNHKKKYELLIEKNNIKFETIGK